MMKSFVIEVLIIFTICIGCSSSYYFQKANPAAVNNAIMRYDKIQLTTFGGKQYNIQIQEMDSLFIRGEGSIRNSGKTAWKPFSGSIPIDSLDLVQFRKKNFGQDLVVLGSAVALMSYFVPLVDENGVSADIQYSGGGTSCPFIYSWNREDYVLDAEAFSIGFGKALELATRSVLSNLKEDASKLKVRIANERLETHYINSVELFAVESDSLATPVLDSGNRIWPIYQRIPPATAHAHDEILEEISMPDNLYYETDLSQLSDLNDFEDVIELTFINAGSASEGSLIIHAINTEFSEIVFKNIFGFLGDQSLTFTHAVENDPEVIDIIKSWIEEGSLKVFVWDGEKWLKEGQLHPAGDAVPFSRIVRIRNPNPESDSLRVRLAFLADVWKIDAANIDWTPVQPLAYKPVDLISAKGPSDRDMMSLLKESDDQYAVLVPPQQIDLTFQLPFPERNKKISYVLKTGGYLHEWFFQIEEEESSFAGLIPDNMKIPFLKNLLQHKNLFLPPVYAEWKKSRVNGKR